MNYEELMLRAITKAEKYKYTAKPNPVVGAIIVNGNEIISEGYHEKYGENHAEAHNKIGENYSPLMNIEHFTREKNEIICRTCK